MKVNKLSIEHYKGIKRIEFFAREINEIAGQNGSGKTSIIDAIVTAIRGPKAKDIVGKDVLRRGESSGEITLDLGDIIVTRKILGDNMQRVKIAAVDGSKWNQSGLDKLYDTLSFDVSKFAFAGPNEQANMIRSILPDDIMDLLDRIELDVSKEREIRLELGRKLKSFGRLAKVEKVEPVDISRLSDELSRAIEINKRNEISRRKIDESKRLINMMKKDVADAEDALKSAEKTLAVAKRNLDEGIEKASQLHSPESDIPLEPIQQRMAEVGAINQRVMQYQEYRRLLDEQTSTARAHEKSEEELARLAKSKTDLIKAAQLPVDGLEWDSTGVRVNGVPFDQLAESERMFISAMICMSMAVDLKILPLRNASLLDEKTYGRIVRACKDRGFQAFFEIVGEPRSKEAIIISEGELVDDSEVKFPW